MISRRRFLLGLGAAATALAGDAFGVEPARVSVTRHAIRQPSASADAPVIRVVQLTDLHLQRVNGHAKKIAKVTNGLQPDLLLMTGDMIDKHDRIPQLREFLALLQQGPVMLATLGNWEHWARVDMNALRATYSDFGCRLLVNESAIVRTHAREVLITGMDDWTAGRPDFDVALKGIEPRANHMLLAHSPVYRDELPASAKRYNIASVLSGHTHGGQVALFGWAPVRPAGSGPYVAGWYSDASPPLYVSRGLGTSVMHVRFGSVPEIAVFEWQLA